MRFTRFYRPLRAAADGKTFERVCGLAVGDIMRRRPIIQGQGASPDASPKLRRDRAEHYDEVLARSKAGATNRMVTFAATIIYSSSWVCIIAQTAFPGEGTSATQTAKRAADAYARAAFVLGLNPIHWEQVKEDADIIAEEVRTFDAAHAERIVETIEHVRAVMATQAPPPPDVDLPANPEDSEIDILPREEAARQVFIQLTRAMSAIVVNRLERLPADGGAAAARAAFGAFVPALERCDPAALARLNSHWDALSRISTTVASSRPAQIGGEDTKAYVEAIRKYFVDNFGPDYTISNDAPLAPIPKASPTSNPRARVLITLPPGSHIAKPIPRPRQILNSVERGALERDMTLSSLGAAAFNNPLMFGEPARALGITCNSCHDKSGNNPAFFIPGLSSRPGNMDVSNSFFAPHGNNAVFDPVDIPDLRGIRFTAPYGRNGRFASLRDFVRNVIVNEFNGEEPDPVLLDAMIVYMNEFDFLRNPALDRDGTLNHRAHEAALRGEKIFNRVFPTMSGRSCASCHIPSANFLDHQRHDIGTVQGYAEYSRDRALDTPTLLGAAFTAPYFHDGSQPTLRAVVEWFNQEYKLGLSEAELADLTSYVSTVGNGVHPYMPGDTFVAEDMEDQYSFLSAFEFLAEKGKWKEITSLCRAVGMETRRQAGNAAYPPARPILNQLADLADEAARDAAEGRHAPAREKIVQWRQTHQREQGKFW